MKKWDCYLKMEKKDAILLRNYYVLFLERILIHEKIIG